MPVFEDRRDDELNRLVTCNLPDTPGMDLWRLAQQGRRAPAPVAGAEPYGGSVVPSAEVASVGRRAPAPVAGAEPYGGSVVPSAAAGAFCAPALPRLGLSHPVGPWT